MTSQVKESAAKANAGKRDASKKLDYQPDPAKWEAYRKNYLVFTKLYAKNKELFSILNRP